MSTTLSTHILDQVSGRPAAGITVVLRQQGAVIAEAVTNADGRVPKLTDALKPGDYTLRFEVASYWKSQDAPTFYPFVEITFTVRSTGHYHVPLLLSPFGYATYRGS